MGFGNGAIWGRTEARVRAEGRMRGVQREGQLLVSTGAGGAVPNTGCPAALEVRNNSKDVSPADGG